MAVASGLTLLTAPLRSIAQQVVRRTPAQILGPYYPVVKPTDQDMDLTTIEGYARLVTDAEGRYRIKTIKPGAYPDDSGTLRAPHIHFEVTGRVNRLVTQAVLAGEPLNDKDRYLVSAAANRGRLIVDLNSVRGDADKALSATWDIVLNDG